MNSSLKKLIKSLLPDVILRKLNQRRQEEELQKWLKNGRPSPPPHLVKQNTITEYQRKSGIGVLVETGTYLGDMVEAQRKRFHKIISIELSPELHARASKRFHPFSHINILQGDSGKVLNRVADELQEAAIFWLDGHYSAGITARGDKDCPVFEEINAIFKSNKPDHILLVDDARCFTGEGDYPTIDELTRHVRSKNERYQVEVKDDIIRYTI
jgi:hypothetical protein